MKRKSKTEEAAVPAVPEFRLEDFLPYRLEVAANRVSRMFAQRYSKAFGLTIPEWRVLAVVGRMGTISPSIVTRGLVKQAQDPNDGRGRLLSLTRKGAGVHNGAMPLALELEASLTEGLNKQEWTVLNKALVKLTTHVAALTGAEAEGEVQ